MSKKHDKKPHGHDLEGTYFLNGSGKISIDLIKKHIPDRIYVRFTDEPSCHPCNPHDDKLHWEIAEDCGHFQLIIIYDVGNVREISYKVIY